MRGSRKVNPKINQINHKVGPGSTYKWSYNPYKWPYQWVTGVTTLLITGSGAHLAVYPHSITVRPRNKPTLSFSQLFLQEKEARPAAMILLQMEWLDAWPCKGKSYLSSSRLAPPNFYRVVGYEVWYGLVR